MGQAGAYILLFARNEISYLLQFWPSQGNFF